jgi:hypothetical protein
MPRQFRPKDFHDRIRGEKMHTCELCGGKKYTRVELPFHIYSTTPVEDEVLTGATSGDTGTVEEVVAGGVISPSNLLLNGGFSATTDNWTLHNSATLSVESNGQAGNCLMITGNGSNEPYASQDFTTVPGAIYRLTYYEKQGTETDYRVLIRDRINSAYLNSSSWLTGNATWTQGTIYFKSPSTCNSISIYLLSRSQSGEGKTYYFDTLDLRRVYSSIVMLSSCTGVTEDSTNGRHCFQADEVLNGSVGGASIAVADDIGTEKAYGVMYPLGYLVKYKGKYYCPDHYNAKLKTDLRTEGEIDVSSLEADRGVLP